MYWKSCGDAELRSVIVRCMGEAPAHVTEQAKVAKVGKGVCGYEKAWEVEESGPATTDIHMYMIMKWLQSCGQWISGPDCKDITCTMWH